MDFSSFMTWALQAILAGVAVAVAQILWSMKGEVKELRKEIGSLNNHVAVIIERSTWHEKVLDQHTERILKLEAEFK